MRVLFVTQFDVGARRVLSSEYRDPTPHTTARIESSPRPKASRGPRDHSMPPTAGSGTGSDAQFGTRKST